MKRLHIHVGVKQLDESVRFYSVLFGAEPVKRKADYAKWMLDDPRVNFAISTRTSKTGVDHLGIQVEEPGELAEIRERLKAAELTTFQEGETVCCYARSDKSWVQDPAGNAWEAYQTMEDAEVYHNPNDSTANPSACCTPESPALTTIQLATAQPNQKFGACN
jgi:catechol 2,3-dioxygenase-like lactoylglutathione lyase family enzyme